MNETNPSGTDDRKRVRFQTGRLVVCDWDWPELFDQDREMLAGQLSEILTKQVTRFLPDHMQVRDRLFDASQWADSLAGESDVCTVRLRQGGDLAGLLILGQRPDPDCQQQVHVGYLFGETFWGQGYATEMLIGLVDWCKRNSMCGQLVGGVESDNLASAAVLRKAGFEVQPELSAANTHIYARNVG